jgi:hypothetical protein
MPIHTLSDLHLGFGAFTPPRTAADVVVLVGDTDQGLRGVRWARSAFGDTPVLYVIGNHECCGQALPKLTGQLSAARADSTVRVPECAAVEVGGIRFMGCTLWTDLALRGTYLAGITLTQAMTNFRAIRVAPAYRRFSPADAASQHRASVAWLPSEWGRSDLTTTVVSHHAPSARSLDPRFADDPVDAGYASALEPLIENLQPVAWIHGLAHRSADYMVASTRIVCNPQGCADKPNQGFGPGLVITVSARRRRSHRRSTDIVSARLRRTRQRQAVHIGAARRERPVRDYDIPDRQIIAQPVGPAQQRQAARGGQIPRRSRRTAGADAAHPQLNGQAPRSHDCLDDSILAARRHDEKQIGHDPSMARLAALRKSSRWEVRNRTGDLNA